MNIHRLDSPEIVSKIFLKYLFGENVLFTTKFDFFELPEKFMLEPEYYYTHKFKFFDFWYNSNQNWIEQLAYALSDFYLTLTNSKAPVLKVQQIILDRFENEVQNR